MEFKNQSYGYIKKISEDKNPSFECNSISETAEERGRERKYLGKKCKQNADVFRCVGFVPENSEIQLLDRSGKDRL